MSSRRWTRILAVLLIAGLTLTGVLSAHDMFLKLRSYFAPPNAAVAVALLNGTFTGSENAIDRNRVADISLMAPDGRTRYDTTAVSARHDTTFLAIKTGGPATYVLGFSTRPTQFKLSGKDFSAYLAEEGLREVAAARRAEGHSADSASERYSKYAKAVFQVGEARTDGYAAILGYPVELVPLENPYSIKPGASLTVRALVRGVPAEGVTILAGGRTPGGTRLPVQQMKTNAGGEATIALARRGVYYVKFISMFRQQSGDVDYVSNWATLTFEIR